MIIIKTIILAVALYVAYKLGKLAKEEELNVIRKKYEKEYADYKKNTQTDLIKNHGKTVKVVRDSKGKFAKKS